MIRKHTIRVFLPKALVARYKLTDNKIYVSEDNSGMTRLEQLYESYGNLKLELCKTEGADKLDDCQPFWKGTITEFFNDGGEYL